MLYNLICEEGCLFVMLMSSLLLLSLRFDIAVFIDDVILHMIPLLLSIIFLHCGLRLGVLIYVAIFAFFSVFVYVQ